MFNKKRDFTVFDNYVETIPYNTKCLEDLISYGFFPVDKLNKYDRNEDGSVELQTVQDSEKDSFDDDPFTYTINKYNFRNAWDFQSSKKRIGFFGCSFTFGEGIADKDTFVRIASNTLNLNPFNFGVGGASVERVARTFSAATRVIDLDYAVVTFPGWHRQYHVDRRGQIINLIPAYPHSGFEKLCNTLTDLDDEYYAVRSSAFVNWVLDIAEYKNIKILLCSWDHPLNYVCKKISPDSTINPFPNIDDKCARDKMHPGVKSQQAHAEQIIEAFNDRAWL